MRVVGEGNGRRVLFVAYPLLPVSEDSSGGAEQVLWTLGRELKTRGSRITVAACSGSEVAGSLYATGVPASGSLGSARMHETRLAAQCMELVSVRESIGAGFSLVHDHSGSFFADAHVHRLQAPVLATLHLPRSFYPAGFFNRLAPNVHFNCVSKSQLKSFLDVPRMMGHVNNGIALERFPVQTRKQDYLLWLGRICEEKGTHTALDVAEKTGLPIVIAGAVYPLAYHQSYFEYEIAPRLQRLGSQAQFVKSPSFATKLELLRNAKAVVITSTAEETSSLVAMEAAACGTPVIAFRRGALSEVVESGVSGMLVRTEEQMCAALEAIHRIQPSACRDRAEKNFSAERMASDYERMYGKVLARSQGTAPPAQFERIAA
ncbi:MAG: glycosyl transferase, group 1 [Candidatus Angelobacter sp.]|jgi:glycosyltransferase involved in cell wall biosynthesis|nr:glycosyl transferase, group 1 [Candidatus Angelobacter sp.]